MQTTSLPAADDVLTGLDLTGRIAMVTGGYSGLGLETTRALAGAGATVVVPARRPEVAQLALSGVAGVEVTRLDLADLASVRAFGDRFLAGGRALDLLIASAAVMACPETRVGDGWEAQLAVNHLGHFALVNRLLTALERSGDARVVMVSSGGWSPGTIRWEDPHFTTGYDKWQAYMQSKVANVLFAAALDERVADRGVRAFSASPGLILTPLQRHLSREEMVAAGWVDDQGRLVAEGFRTPEQGAATQVWAATSPRLAGRGGMHCEDCAVTDDRGTLASSPTAAREAARLWELSASLTGAGG